MYKKIIAAILCVTMAGACIGCGSEKDSSSKSESSSAETTEAVTEAQTETAALESEAAALESDNEVLASEAAALESEIEVAEGEDELPTADTATVTAALLSGTWKSGYILDGQGNMMTIKDYCETLGADPSTFDLSMKFAEDGTVQLTSTTDGNETGKYTVDGILITLTDDADGSELALMYDTESGMVFVDLLGTGEILIGFTVA